MYPSWFMDRETISWTVELNARKKVFLKTRTYHKISWEKTGNLSFFWTESFINADIINL